MKINQHHSSLVNDENWPPFTPRKQTYRDQVDIYDFYASKKEQMASNDQPLLSIEFSQFKKLILKLEKRVDRKGPVFDRLLDELDTCFRTISSLINDEIGDKSHLDQKTKNLIGEQYKAEMLPYILHGNFSERMFVKPRGYAGDFYTINMMYEDKEDGTARIGPIIDRCFLNGRAVRAVKNRRKLISDFICAEIKSNGSKPYKVSSFACGPAREIFDTLEKTNSNALKVNLLDVDEQALSFVKNMTEKSVLGDQIQTIHANLINVVAGTECIPVWDQNLIYSIGLIDYFNDKFVINLINNIYDRLITGGKVILGNFHPQNEDKAVMDHILEWRLIHRNEDDLSKLFLASKFQQVPEFKFEDEDINLFAICTK